VRDHDALLALLGERLNTPFAWASNDCCSFAFDCALAQTGHDAWADERGRYATAIGAARVIRRYGGVQSIADARFARIAPSMAMRGDLALVSSAAAGDAMSLAVVEGSTLVAVGVDGLVRLPRSAALAAWSIEQPANRSAR